MSQFYVSENYKHRADFYRQVLAVPQKEREQIARNAAESARRYLIGGSSFAKFEQNRSTESLYSQSDIELQKKICEYERKAELALVAELDRCRSWLLAAFDLKKKVATMPDEIKAHNLKCAREWVTTTWPDYKAARKIVKGF